MPTSSISTLSYSKKKLPVDSRHNAKIHRLSLSKNGLELLKKNNSNSLKK